MRQSSVLEFMRLFLKWIFLIFFVVIGPFELGVRLGAIKRFDRFAVSMGLFQKHLYIGQCVSVYLNPITQPNKKAYFQIIGANPQSYYLIAKPYMSIKKFPHMVARSILEKYSTLVNCSKIEEPD